MRGYITSCWKVKRVVTPAFGHTIDGSHGPSFFGPLGVTGWVTVELDPFGGEVPEQSGFSKLWVHPGGQELCSLHGDVDALHPAYLLGPREGVLSVQDDDEAGAVTSVFLLPQLQQLGQVETVTPCSRGGLDSDN